MKLVGEGKKIAFSAAPRQCPDFIPTASGHERNVDYGDTGLLGHCPLKAFMVDVILVKFEPVSHCGALKF